MAKKANPNIFQLIFIPFEVINVVVFEPLNKRFKNNLIKSLPEVFRFVLNSYSIISFVSGLVGTTIFRIGKISLNVVRIIMFSIIGGDVRTKLAVIDDEVNARFNNQISPIKSRLGTANTVFKFSFNFMFDMIYDPIEEVLETIRKLFGIVFFVKKPADRQIITAIKGIVYYFYNMLIMFLDYIEVLLEFIERAAIFDNGKDKKTMTIYYNKYLKNNKNVNVSLEQWIESEGKAIREINGELQIKRLNIVNYVVSNKRFITNTNLFFRELGEREHEREENFIEKVY